MCYESVNSDKDYLSKEHEKLLFRKYSPSLNYALYTTVYQYFYNEFTDVCNSNCTRKSKLFKLEELIYRIESVDEYIYDQAYFMFHWSVYAQNSLLTEIYSYLKNAG